MHLLPTKCFPECDFTPGFTDDKVVVHSRIQNIYLRVLCTLTALLFVLSVSWTISPITVRGMFPPSCASMTYNASPPTAVAMAIVGMAPVIVMTTGLVPSVSSWTVVGRIVQITAFALLVCLYGYVYDTHTRTHLSIWLCV